MCRDSTTWTLSTQILNSIILQLCKNENWHHTNDNKECTYWMGKLLVASVNSLLVPQRTHQHCYNLDVQSFSQSFVLLHGAWQCTVMTMMTTWRWPHNFWVPMSLCCRVCLWCYKPWSVSSWKMLGWDVNIISLLGPSWADRWSVTKAATVFVKICF